MPLLKTVFVQEMPDPVARRDIEVVVTLGADVQSLLHFLAKDCCLTPIAADPQALGNASLASAAFIARRICLAVHSLSLREHCGRWWWSIGVFHHSPARIDGGRFPQLRRVLAEQITPNDARQWIEYYQPNHFIAVPPQQRLEHSRYSLVCLRNGFAARRADGCR